MKFNKFKTMLMSLNKILFLSKNFSKEYAHALEPSKNRKRSKIMTPNSKALLDHPKTKNMTKKA